MEPSWGPAEQGGGGEAKPFLRHLLVDLAIACVCAVAIMSFLGARSPKLTERENARVEGIRRVARSELVFARERAAPEEVRRSVASVAAFMERRAGVALDAGVAERLVALELRALDGRLGRLTVEEASAIFSEVLCERIRDASDAEIASAAEGFGNVIPIGRLAALDDDLDARFAAAKRLRVATGELAAKRAEQPPNGVLLRYDGSGNMPPDAFVSMVKDLRDRLRTPAMFMLATGQAAALFETYLDDRVAALERAAPESWAKARSEGLTPVQAMLVAYSAASDDGLHLTSDQLAVEQEYQIDRYLPAAMKSARAARPAPFGRNGDLFSSPLDMVFDAKTLGRLLDAVEKGGSR